MLIYVPGSQLFCFFILAEILLCNERAFSLDLEMKFRLRLFYNETKESNPKETFQPNM